MIATTDRARARPAVRPSWEGRLLAALMTVLVVIASVLFLRELRAVIVPFLFALLLSYLAYPPVRMLTRRGVPIGAAIGLVVSLAIVLLGGTAILVEDSLSGFLAAYPRYEPRIERLWDRVSSGWGVTSRYLQDIDISKKIAAWGASALGSLVGFLADFSLALFYLVFLLLGRVVVPRKIKKAFNPERGAEILKIMDEIEGQSLRYVGLMTLISFVTALAVYGILLAYGIESAFVWSALVFLGNFVPTIGPILATIPPILVAMAQYDSTWAIVSLAVTLTISQVFLGNIVEPRVMGRGLELDPLVILFGLVFFGWLWGIVGVLLAVPLMVVIRIVCEHFEITRPVAVMMGSSESKAAAP